MRITLISTQLGMGGAENLVCNLADEFVAQGHQVQLVSLLGEPVVTPRSPEVQVVNLRLNKRNPASWPLGLAYFRRAVGQFAPDIVHAHSFHSIALARLLRPMMKFPRLISSGHSQQEGVGRQAPFYRYTDFLSDIMTNISEEATEALVKRTRLDPQRVVTVYNGIDTRRHAFSEQERAAKRAELGLEAEDRVLIAIGRINPQKDFPNLLNALALLEVQDNPPRPLTLLLVGTGPDEIKQQLEQQIKQLKLNTQVKFLGMRRDVPALLSAADIFVLSSAWEGFGLVVAEAMACERVVVATDCGGVREVVGEAGFLCPPKDPAALASQLRQALTLSPQQAAALGRAARERVVRQYGLEQVTKRWLQLYRDIQK